MLTQSIYERQNLISDLKIPKVASVVGCGGTGFWTAILLAMSGVEELILVDHDRVEVSNLNRLPLQESYVGVRKIAAIREFVAKIRKLVRIEEHDKRIEKPEDCIILRGMVFCCTDNLKNQQLICAYCKKNKIPYQRVGYDGTVLNVSKTFPLSFKQIPERDGYTITPSWVIPAVLASALGVSSKLYKELCIMDDIGKLHIQECSYVSRKILDDEREEEREDILDNINDYIPDGYGYCDDCSKCSDCERVDLDNGYGYCQDCEDRYTEVEIDEMKEDAEQKGIDETIEQIESGDIENKHLLKALEIWQNRKNDNNKEDDKDVQTTE
jgi:molybdopterin/thiamine biosynthesis adenylyltransferase